MATMERNKTGSLPGIVFITTDTQGREMLSCYLKEPRVGVETPELDAFAARSVRFANAFTSSPLCGPARTSWYTGLMPSQHHTIGNNVPCRHGLDMVGARLSRRGYQCHHLGKWHVGGNCSAEAIRDSAFEASTWYGEREFYAEVGEDGPNRWKGWNKGLEDPSFCYGRRVADRAIGLIRRWRPGDRAMFLAVDLDEPHGPYIAPPPFAHKYRGREVYHAPTLRADVSAKPVLHQALRRANLEMLRDGPRLPNYYRAYYACNSFIDHEIGRIVRAAESYLPAGTLIVFTSDHGDHLGAFGLGPKGPTMYDCCTAVPLIIHRVGGRRRGVVEAGLVSHLDVVHTILEAAGAETVEGSGASSLLPALAGDGPTRRDAVFCEFHRFSARNDYRGGFYPIRSIRTYRWKLNINLLDRDELYDLDADPHEAANLIDDPVHDVVRRDLHDRLIADMTARRDVLAGDAWAMRPWRPERTWVAQSPGPSGTQDHWRADHLGNWAEGAF